MAGTPQHFGQRLKLAMQDRKWVARDLHQASGVSEGAISRHLKQEEPPKPATIEKYRVALEVEAEWLAYGRGPMRRLGRERSEERLLYPHATGQDALERVLLHYAWPDVEIDIVDSVIKDARADAWTPGGKDRPESAWHLRLRQLLQARAKGRD